MRERLFISFSLFSSVGITPAYAGKTGHQPDRFANVRDHPRVCGKDVIVTLA